MGKTLLLLIAMAAADKPLHPPVEVFAADQHQWNGRSHVHVAGEQSVDFQIDTTAAFISPPKVRLRLLLGVANRDDGPIRITVDVNGQTQTKTVPQTFPAREHRTDEPHFGWFDIKLDPAVIERGVNRFRITSDTGRAYLAVDPEAEAPIVRLIALHQPVARTVDAASDAVREVRYEGRSAVLELDPAQIERQSTLAVTLPETMRSTMIVMRDADGEAIDSGVQLAASEEQTTTLEVGHRRPATIWIEPAGEDTVERTRLRYLPRLVEPAPALDDVLGETSD